jgi:hypothetical protein
MPVFKQEGALRGLCSGQPPGDNGELISSAHNLGQVDGCRVKEPSQGRSSDGSVFLFTHFRSIHVTNTSETQSQAEQPASTAPSGRSSRKSVLALSVFAICLNTTAAVYTVPSFDIALPNVSSWVGLLLARQEASAPISDADVAVSFDDPSPNFSSLDEQLSDQQASAPKPDPVIAALRDIQSTQQQHVASLQQNTALLQQDSTTLALLRQSVTDEQVDVKKISAQIKDEHVDVKKMSAQLSTLIAKVDSLQNAIAPEITSSIPRGARNRRSGVVRKRMAGQPKPVGAVSVGGAPLSFPTMASVRQD